jgi:hypothetical protein
MTVLSSIPNTAPASQPIPVAFHPEAIAQLLPLVCSKLDVRQTRDGTTLRFRRKGGRANADWAVPLGAKAGLVVQYDAQERRVDL